MVKVAIYYRVSTDKQDLTSQKHTVEKWLLDLPEKEKPKKIYVFEDEGFSGKDHGRPGFRQMMQAAAKKEIDTIIVYRLDRFSRNATVAIKTILELDEYGVGFISVTQPVLNLGHNNPFRRTMLAAFAEIAEIERDTIVARVKSGLDAARKRGTKLGAPIKASEEKRIEAEKLHEEGLSFKVIANRLEISVGSVHNLLKNQERV